MGFQYTSSSALPKESWGNGFRQMLFTEVNNEADLSWSAECFLSEWEEYGIFPVDEGEKRILLLLEGTPLLRTGDREQTLSPIEPIEYFSADPMESFGACKLLNLSVTGTASAKIHFFEMKPNLPYSFSNTSYKTMLYCSGWPMVMRQEKTAEQNLYPGDFILLDGNETEKITLYSDREQSLIVINFEKE